MWRLYGDYYNIWRSLYGMDQNMDIGDGWMDIQRSWNFMWNPQWTDHTQHTQPWSSLSLNRISELCHGESNLRSQKISKKCDTLMSWWKSCFMGFLEMSWCWSEIAWVSLRFPQSLGFLKLATVVFWRNTWHRRSWTSHMSTMRRPVEWPFWGRNCWWLIGNQPYMEVLSNGHISWDNIGILFRSLGQQPRFLGVLSVFIEKMMVNQWILGCRTRFSDKPGPLLDTTSTSTDCCWYDLLGPWLHYMFTE